MHACVMLSIVYHVLWSDDMNFYSNKKTDNITKLSCVRVLSCMTFLYLYKIYHVCILTTSSSDVYVRSFEQLIEVQLIEAEEKVDRQNW